MQAALASMPGSLTATGISWPSVCREVDRRGDVMDARVPDTEAMADLLGHHLPGFRVVSAVCLGQGLDNVSYEINGELIIRFSKECDPDRRAELVSGEARLLAVVASISPVPVPDPIFVAPERGCLAYRKLAGRPMIDLPSGIRATHTDSVAAVMGEVLSALHATTHGRIGDLVEIDVQPMQLWLTEAADNYAAVATALPSIHRRAAETFFSTPPPADCADIVFSHNDLGIEHILFDPRAARVTGILDWSDVAMIDPAYDFGLLYRDLGPTALTIAMHTYRTRTRADEGTHARAEFYARCSVFEDLAYALRTGHTEYLDKSLDSLRWLFPTGR
ncbi:phosphotransferase family protein [Nocardia sp. NPDC059239]|uniref:phosphotransferase family protein n=1 Tax=unclassified Nocardia TaxID=2637762 RepID=UPI0036797B63